jgi:NAD(P)-dependent dehydrogenase (short-subunit alcohol dehydrogenase family)
MSSKVDFSKELIGRRALVTGGTRGMGAAIAQRLLDAGAKVVVTGRSRGEATPAGATFIVGDVSSVEGVKAIAANAVGALGGLDILVNNAGGARPIAEGTASIPEEEWQASFGLNLFAAVRLTNAVLPALRESKVGAIVNISSNAAARRGRRSATRRALRPTCSPSQSRSVASGPRTTWRRSSRCSRRIAGSG